MIAHVFCALTRCSIGRAAGGQVSANRLGKRAGQRYVEPHEPCLRIQGTRESVDR